jgi:hypothetical protein
MFRSIQPCPSLGFLILPAEKNKPRLIKDNEPFAFPGVWETLATEWRREA